MKVGVPREIKNNENRVGMVPAGVKAMTNHRHLVLVQSGAGLGSGIADEEFVEAGAQLVPDLESVYDQADLVVKVKEPLPEEYGLLREGQTLFTYLHLAPAPDVTRALVDSGVVAIAYETIQLADGSLPLLVPMSEVAGRLAIQVGAHYLEKEEGGRGQLLGGVPGTRPGKVVVAGGGTVGINAAKMAVGLGARVVVFDLNLERLRYLDDVFCGRVTLLASSEYALLAELADADLVVGAVLVPGARAPRVLTRELIGAMPAGSVLVDVAVDQGGCAETTHPTTHDDPVYMVDGVLHYCVANMPACVARTSTFALTNATLPYALKLADRGYADALLDDPALLRGLNVIDGHVACAAVAESLGCECRAPESILK